MIILNVDEVINDLNGKPTGQILISVDEMIRQVQINSETETLLKSLEKIKEDTPGITYLEVYQKGCFGGINAKDNPALLTEALKLSDKIKAGEDISDPERDKLKKGITNIEDRRIGGIIQAVAIRNIEESDKPLTTEDK